MWCVIFISTIRIPLDTGYWEARVHCSSFKSFTSPNLVRLSLIVRSCTSGGMLAILIFLHSRPRKFYIYLLQLTIVVFEFLLSSRLLPHSLHTYTNCKFCTDASPAAVNLDHMCIFLLNTQCFLGSFVHMKHCYKWAPRVKTTYYSIVSVILRPSPRWLPHYSPFVTTHNTICWLVAHCCVHSTQPHSSNNQRWRDSNQCSLFPKRITITH